MVKRNSGHFLRDLNDAQRAAVTTIDGPLLVLAGAGTGKTRVITCRVAHLLRQGVAPGSILGVTFTNKAAREMRERVAGILGKRPQGLTLSTFHSLGMRILRAEASLVDLRPNFSILDSSDQQSLMRDVLRGIRGSATTADARPVLNAVSLAKNRFALPGDLLEEAETDEEHLLARAYHRYAEKLRLLNCVDFDDLILLPVRALLEHESLREKYRRRFRYVMIDEYQDTNGSQYRFTRALVGRERNVCVVGDDDQSIYGFRGAEMDKILRFERDFPGARVVTLEHNYRSTTPVLDLANAVIELNAERRPKRLRSVTGAGDPVTWVRCPDGEAEVQCVVQRIEELRRRGGARLEDIAVLFRSSFQARPFEEKLRLRQLPYTLVGGQSYFDRKEIRDLLAYWNVVNNPGDDVSLLRVINFPRRGLGDTAIRRLDELARGRGVSVSRALELAAGGEAGLSARARAGAESLSGILRRGRETLRSRGGGAMCRFLVEELSYRQALGELYPDPEALQARWGAVEDLLRAVDEWQRRAGREGFGSFLGALTLDAQDDRGEEDVRGLALMTLHSAKGLEFPAVFLVGVEEEILPHRKSIEDGDRAIEEERRLFYVGITRARRLLTITTAERRTSRGSETECQPSRFLTELGDSAPIATEVFDPNQTASEEVVADMLARFRDRRTGSARANGDG